MLCLCESGSTLLQQLALRCEGEITPTLEEGNLSRPPGMLFRRLPWTAGGPPKDEDAGGPKVCWS